MAILKNILQRLFVSDQIGANYSSLNTAVADTLKTYKIESAITLTANITFATDSTLIIGPRGSISGAFTLTGDNTILIIEGDRNCINTNVIFAGTWICDNVKPEWWGAVGNGVTDDYAAILDAIAFCKLTSSKRLQFNPKIYRSNGNGSIAVSGLTIIGNGATLLVNSGIAVSAASTIGTFYNLTGNAYKGDSWLMCTNATLLASLSQGDLVKVISNEIIQEDANEATRYGEIHEVREVDSGNGYIYFNDYLFHSYSTTDTARVARISPTSLKIRDFKVKVEAVTDDAHIAFYLGGVKDLVLDNVSAQAYHVCFGLYDCYSPVLRVKSFQSDRAGFGYGVNIGGATMYADISGVLIGARHCLTTGNGGISFGADAGGLCWGLKVHDSIGTAGISSSSIFDTHATSGSSYFDNCIAIGGVFRTLVSSIVDWDNSTTFSVDQLVRSTLKELYKALQENTNVDPDTDVSGKWAGDWGHTGQTGFKAEGLYNYYTNCKVIGCLDGVRVTGVDAERTVIKDFTTENCYRSVYSLFTAQIKELCIDGLTAINDHKSGLAIYLLGKIGKWSFDNIHTRNAVVFSAGSTESVFPSQLTINNFSCDYLSTKPSSSRAISITVGSIKQITIRNGQTSNINLAYTYDQNTQGAIEMFSIQNVNCDAPTGDLIKMENPVTNMMLSGIQARNPVAENYFLSFKYSLTSLSILNCSWIGTNATKLIYSVGAAALSYLLHNCNLFPNMTTFRTGDGAEAATVITDGSLGAAGKVTT